MYGVCAMLCLITSHGICSHTVGFSKRHKAFSLTRVPDAPVLSPSRPRLGPHQPHPISAATPPIHHPPTPAHPSHHLYNPDQESCRGPSTPGPGCPAPRRGPSVPLAPFWLVLRPQAGSPLSYPRPPPQPQPKPRLPPPFTHRQPLCTPLHKSRSRTCLSPCLRSPKAKAPGAAALGRGGRAGWAWPPWFPSLPFRCTRRRWRFWKSWAGTPGPGSSP